MIWCSIGPRITIGLSPGEMYPMEIVFTPCVKFGSIWFCGPTLGCALDPIMSGMFGP